MKFLATYTYFLTGHLTANCVRIASHHVVVRTYLSIRRCVKYEYEKF